MVEVVIDTRKYVKSIAKQLGLLENDAPKVLKNAINSTARKVKRTLAKKAMEKYNTSAKMTDITKKEKLKGAKVTALTAKITTKSESTALSKFPFSRDGAVRVSVMAKSGYKGVYPKNANGKVFTTRFESGHLAIVYRRTKQRLPVSEVRAVSIAQMVGNKESFEETEPDIVSMLETFIQKNIVKTLAGGGAK